MTLLIAFVAGAVSATVLIVLVRHGAGGAGETLLVGVRAELASMQSDQRALNSELAGRMHTLSEAQATVLTQTGQLAQALRRPGVRGHWGELTLHNVAEAAGLAEYIDFERQLHVPGEDGGRAARPDMVIRLPGGGSVPVDSKAPMDAYWDATAEDDPRRQAALLDRHVQAVRDKVRELAAKEYWKRFDRSPEMVVLFIPSEAAFAAAAQRDRALIVDAARQRVAIATPSTMLALLQVVALGWREARMSDDAARVAKLAGELVDRVGVMGGHLHDQAGALERAVRAHNSAVASFEGRLLVTARRIDEFGAGDADRLSAPRRVDTAVRRVDAAPPSEGADAPSRLGGARESASAGAVGEDAAPPVTWASRARFR